jgi:hypothetical protein
MKLVNSFFKRTASPMGKVLDWFGNKAHSYFALLVWCCFMIPLVVLCVC